MSDFRARLRRGDCLAGTWLKTPHPHAMEVLALSALDVVAIDAEHAPFDRADIDACVLAARAGGMAVLVRPASAAPEHLLQALDVGADGVVAPHIRSADEAAALVRHCHYVPGGRGFAGSTRAAAYTTRGMAGQRTAARDVTIIAQIEDREALDDIDAIAAVEGIDALFVGRADLTVSLERESPDDPAVVEAVAAICAAGRAAGRAVGMFLNSPAEVPRWREQGAGLFLLSSDQSFMLAGANTLAAAIRGD